MPQAEFAVNIQKKFVILFDKYAYSSFPLFEQTCPEYCD